MKTPSFLSALLVIATTAMLAACSSPPPPEPLEPLKLTGSSYTFNVGSINVVQDYHSPKVPPNVEHMGDLSPTQAVKQWAGTRLVAAGHDNSLEVAIEDASIVRRELPKEKTGIEGMLTTEQTEQFDGTLHVILKIYNPQNALPVAHVEASAHASQTLPQNAAPIDRERAVHRISVELMKLIEPQLDADIQRYLSSYLL